MSYLFFFQAEDGIRDLVRSRGLGDVYKRQGVCNASRKVKRGQSAAQRRASNVEAEVHHVAILNLSLIHI